MDLRSGFPEDGSPHSLVVQTQDSNVIYKTAHLLQPDRKSIKEYLNAERDEGYIEYTDSVLEKYILNTFFNF